MSTAKMSKAQKFAAWKAKRRAEDITGAAETFAALAKSKKGLGRGRKKWADRTLAKASQSPTEGKT